jgi:hypothetical protein
MSWYGPPWVWCIDRDRYFFRDSRGWTSAVVSWKSLPDSTFRATPLAADEVRFRFYPTHAQVLTRASGSFRVSEKLEPLTGAELAGTWRDIRALPSVESACDRARRCARATQAARAQVQAAPSDDVPRDLGNCLRLISTNLGALRKSREPKHEAVRSALAACTR